MVCLLVKNTNKGVRLVVPYWWGHDSYLNPVANAVRAGQAAWAPFAMAIATAPLSFMSFGGFGGYSAAVIRGGGEGSRLLQRFNSVESLVQNAGKLQRLKGGIRQGVIKGNPDDIFRGLAQQYGATIQTSGSKVFFQSGNLRVGLHSSIRGGGTPTLNINNMGNLFKIRITP
jgi:hypothetical protein